MIDQYTKNLLAILRKQAYLAKYALYMDDEQDEIRARLDDVALRIEQACDELEDRLHLLCSRSANAAPSLNDRWLDPAWPAGRS